MVYLGVDIGGTKIAAGIVSEDGRLIKRQSIPTDVEGGPQKIARDIQTLLKLLMGETSVSWEDIPYLGVGCPGTIDHKRGIVKYANNLNFTDIPLGPMLRQNLPVPVYLENDANCAGLGEYCSLEDRHSVENFFMLTLGTGIGSALVLNGHLFRGFNGAAPETGHCVIQMDGIPCLCGNRGCWEMYCSGHALADKTRETARQHPESRLWELAGGETERMSGRTAFQAYRLGDRAGVAIVEEYLRCIKVGVANIVNSYQPQVLTLGGGIGECEDSILKAAEEAVLEGSYCKTLEHTSVRRAKLGGSAGIYGAAWLMR